MKADTCIPERKNKCEKTGSAVKPLRLGLTDRQHLHLGIIRKVYEKQRTFWATAGLG